MPEESAGEQVEETGAKIRSRRENVGQKVDEGIDSAKSTGQGISKKIWMDYKYWMFTEESAGEKIEQAGEQIRSRRETVGQNVDEGIDKAKGIGQDLSELYLLLHELWSWS